MTSVTLLSEGDRKRFCDALGNWLDFPHQLAYIYARQGGAMPTYVAWNRDEVVGMLTGSFYSDFEQIAEFAEFDMPSPPHAYLERLFVPKHFRRGGIGRSLVRTFLGEALSRRCSFVAGSIDLSGDVQGRSAFFLDMGFDLDSDHRFGAEVHRLLEHS